ncbi:dihydropteroate synthase [Plantibacter sp. VKM Ac-2880]|uniref:dihydropteroate synthase n=1 Tax=Plantibacter sp. VKM Ac-2880 TaxID=2783827 RepID=UPI0018906C59|nr:dihydropteroate synthase [Plantibacter sp. VKM Ac-2880]MBF4568619.1 dihydropteroate synthase [Plantibacter sp. VKM Ac-2880]
MTSTEPRPDQYAAVEPVRGFPLPPIRQPIRRIGARTFDFSKQVAVMAIINRTPDSFFDQGATFSLDRAVEAAVTAAEQGADWVDIGGAKFAPGPEIPAAEELDRVLPVVEALAARSDVVISVDTFRPEVAAACIAAGASVINDTTGIHDPTLADVVAASEATLVITHSLAKPRQPHPRPHYDDVAREVAAFLADRVELAIAHGVPESRLIVDPGHDLNKTTVQTLELTRHLGEIAALGFPTLAAVSNKDFIGESLDRPKTERLEGSLAAATACILLGARIVRMHAVPESIAAVRMVEAILGFRAPVAPVHNL